MTKEMAAYQCKGCMQVFKTLHDARECCYSVITSDVFTCPRCHKRHPYMDMAQTCCAIKGKAGHQCSYCKAFHLKKEDARECCHPAERVTVYVCDACRLVYRKEEDAAKCCKKKEN